MKTYSYQQGSIEERVIQVAHYIIEHNATVRQAAGAFGVSKSTVHKDLTDRLLHINPSLAAQARKNPGCEQAGKTHSWRNGHQG